MSRLRAFPAIAAVCAVAACTAVAAPPAGYKLIATGPAPGGAVWQLSAKHGKLSGLAALCLSFTVQPPPPIDVVHTPCVGGSLRAWNSVFPVSVGPSANRLTLVGGVTVERARRIVVTFGDGTKLTVPARLGPPSFRRALGENVRFFATNAYPRTKTRARSVTAFDAGGRPLGTSKLGA